MTTPTAPAQKAAQQVVHVMHAVGILSVDQATALIDSATGLPALLAERDALREALCLIEPLELAHWSETGYQWFDGEQEHPIPKGLGEILIKAIRQARKALALALATNSTKALLTSQECPTTTPSRYILAKSARL